MKQRYLFIDLYRTAVILLMLEGHVFRAFLQPAVQRSPFFQLHEFFHGLSAPAFLFGAGLTFVISTRKKWENYHHWGRPLALRIRRLLLVIALGLALHLPYFSLRKILNECTLADSLQLFQFDVLHCIGIGLLSLHMIIFFFKKESRFYGLVFATILAFCFLTPLVWDTDFLKILPPAFAQAFNGNHGSPFPLFPYTGFLFVGVIVSWEFFIASDRKEEKLFMMRLCNAGMVLIITGIVSDIIPVRVYPVYNYWFTSPSYFLLRAGALMLMTGVFWYIAQYVRNPRKIVTVLGIESLFVYAAHLVVVYGTAVNPDINLQKICGTDLSPLLTATIFLGVLLAMLAASLSWNFLKENHPVLYRSAQLLGGGLILILFISRKY